MARGAVLLLVALGACAGPQPQGVVQAPSPIGGWQRPTSYDPPGPSHDPWGPWIREASRRFDVPERWVREVMRQESGGRAGATSHAGAMGLMQVMPGTYRELRDRYGLGDDPYHPYDSIMAGTAYIREMYELYGAPAFLAAYNGGPRRLEDYLWNNRGLPNETRNYVARIGPRIAGSSPNRRAAPEVYAAAEIPLNIPPGPRRMDGATMLALREQRQATDPGIQVARLPAGPVVRMEPIPDGSTGSYQVASLSGPVVRMDPIPDGSTGRLPAAVGGPVVRMEPIPDGATPEGAARLAAVAARDAAASEPQPLPAPAVTASPVGRFGVLPTPAPAATPVAPRPVALAASPVAATPLAPPRARSGFGLVSTAQAAPVRLPAAAPVLRTSAPAAGWAVQVGAFASRNLATSAADQARGAAGVLGARADVKPLAQGGGTLYRARVTGLSRDAAQSLCDRLRGRGGCMLLAPDAQG